MHTEYYQAGHGLTASGDAFCAAWGTLDRRDGNNRLIIWCHSAGYAIDDLFSPVADTGIEGDPIPIGQVLMALAEAGFVVIMPMHGDGSGAPAGGAWGNDTARTRISQLQAWAQTTGANKGGARSGKVALFGGSMGGTTTWSYAKSIGYANVAGIATVAGALDLSFMRGTDTSHTPTLTDWTGTFYSSVNLAYGGNGADPDGVFNDAAFFAAKASRDPATIMTQAGFKDLGVLVHYGDADLIIGAQTTSGDRIADAIAPLTNKQVYVQPGGGHNNYLKPEVYVDFFNSLNWVP
jgi:pimeloyl-ACP methyl ester carboxylesterase